MEIPGWLYLIFGIVIAGVSGYVYYYIPRSNGQPNMAMALFFFIGILFILIGVGKILFRKIEKKHEAIEMHNFNVKQKQQPEEPKVNRVEAHIQKLVQQEESQKKPQEHLKQNLQHTNRWYQAHPYQGPHHQTHQPQYTIISCAKCAAKNHSTSNFCHVCGTKLK